MPATKWWLQKEREPFNRRIISIEEWVDHWSTCLHFYASYKLWPIARKTKKRNVCVCARTQMCVCILYIYIDTHMYVCMSLNFIWNHFRVNISAAVVLNSGLLWCNFLLINIADKMGWFVLLCMVTNIILAWKRSSIYRTMLCTWFLVFNFYWFYFL